MQKIISSYFSMNSCKVRYYVIHNINSFKRFGFEAIFLFNSNMAAGIVLATMSLPIY